MQIIDVADQRTLPASVVTIGSFDGVHRGHKQLLNSLRQIGTKAGLRTALVTFDRIPRAVISPEAAPPLLCNIETRLDLLRQTGLVDYCCVLPFDEQRQRETVDDFVINNLVRRLGMRILVVGENFACGRGRKGDLAYLSALGEQFGFTVQPQPLHAPHGAPRCSSTETRRLIQLGELTEAARLLDRSHEMTGVVMEETGANQSNRLRVVVDANLCTPPKDAYLGAIRMTDQQGRWKKAILKVSDLTSRGRNIVHLTFGGALPVKTGDGLTMRFAQRMAYET